MRLDLSNRDIAMTIPVSRLAVGVKPSRTAEAETHMRGRIRGKMSPMRPKKLEN